MLNKQHESTARIQNGLINVSKDLETFIVKIYCCFQKTLSRFSIQFGALHKKTKIRNASTTS